MRAVRVSRRRTAAPRAARATALVLFVVVATVQPLAAQTGGRLETAADDIEDAVGDILHLWSAPLRVDVADVPALLALTDAVLISALYDDEVQDWVRRNPGSVPVRMLAPVRESQPLSRLGLTRTLLPLAGAVYGVGLAVKSPDLREAGLGCATADVGNTLARHAIARLIGRLRPESRRGPYVIEPLAFGGWHLRSFPNGHGANIMACTAFLNRRFDLGVAEPLLYALALMTGAARIADEAHWLSDTVFGAVFGWAVGAAVADRQVERSQEDASAGESSAAGRGPPLYLGWRISVP